MNQNSHTETGGKKRAQPWPEWPSVCWWKTCSFGNGWCLSTSLRESSSCWSGRHEGGPVFFFFVFVCLLASPCPFTFHSLTSWKADGPRIGRRRRIRRCFSRGRPRKGEEEGRSRFAHSYHGHLLLRLILLLLILEMRASCAAISAAAFYRRATVHDNDVIEILFLFFSSLSWAGARAFGPAEKSLCRPW